MIAHGHLGFSQKQVLQILGEPLKVEVNRGGEHWYYGPPPRFVDASLTFKHDRLLQWIEPDRSALGFPLVDGEWD
jgi:hypothetical protein